MKKVCRTHQNKHPHPNKTAAVAHAIKAQKELGHQVHTYKCQGCKKWFVGGSKLSKYQRLLHAIDKANGEPA